MTYEERLEAATDLAAATKRGTDEFFRAVDEAQERYDIHWREIGMEMSRRSAVARKRRAASREAKATWDAAVAEDRKEYGEPRCEPKQWEAPSLFGPDTMGAIRR